MGPCLWASRYLGQMNPTDFFTRLLCGIAYTGVAPRSFYGEAPGGSAHFNGMPVDFVAAVIAAAAAAERAKIGTYHVVNPHYDDAISLDTVADWVQSAGYPVGPPTCQLLAASSCRRRHVEQRWCSQETAAQCDRS